MKKTYFHFSLSTSDDFLERQAFITIQKINDATVLIAVPFQTLAHDDIGLVCVDADVADLAFAIVQDGVQNAM